MTFSNEFAFKRFDSEQRVISEYEDPIFTAFSIKVIIRRNGARAKYSK